MVTKTGDDNSKMTIRSLRKELSPYTKPDMGKAITQIVNTFIPYIIVWGILVYMVNTGYHPAGILALIVLASLLLVRIFIIFHDCTHGSFFASKRANSILGYISGILVFTPFHYWRNEHNVHHGTYADLDKRGIGDIFTMTVEEYQAAAKKKRAGYRLYRNPFVFLILGPFYTFIISHRFTHKSDDNRVRHSVAITNLALMVIIFIASQTIGLWTYLLIQLPIMVIAGAVGVWLFYIQHQFEGVYWSRHEEWDPLEAALKGSSYYKLPKVLQWFTGNIGLHHVHHVHLRIPNYHLQQCLDKTPSLQTVRPLTLRGSLKSLFLNLWDEKQQKLVSFRALKTACT